MSENHDQQSQDMPSPKQASPQTVITMLNQRLDEKAQHIRRLEDAEIALAALVNDFSNENAAMKAAMDQIAAENKTLRERLGIDELGAIESVDSDSVNNTLDT